MARWVLLVHGDSDGVVSGALAYYYFSSHGHDVSVYFTHPAGLAGDLREFVEHGDNVFIADIALSEAHLGEIKGLFRRISSWGKLIYIDHHPEPLGLKPRDLSGVVVHDTCCSASELTYRFFAERGLGEEYSRVALYGAIGDYLDETVWVKSMLRRWDKRMIYFEAGVLVQGLEGSRKLYDFKRGILKMLARNELPSRDSELLLHALVQSRRDEALRLWVKNSLSVRGIVAIVANPPGSLGRAANYALIYSGKPIGLAYEERGNVLVMSLRSMVVNLNRLLRRVSGLVGGTGGGHSFAAGARIPRHRLEDFLGLINEYYSSFITTEESLSTS